MCSVAIRCGLIEARMAPVYATRKVVCSAAIRCGLIEAMRSIPRASDAPMGAPQRFAAASLKLGARVARGWALRGVLRSDSLRPH